MRQRTRVSGNGFVSCRRSERQESLPGTRKNGAAGMRFVGDPGRKPAIAVVGIFLHGPDSASPLTPMPRADMAGHMISYSNKCQC